MQTPSKRRARMIRYMDENPNRLYTSSYDEHISDDEATLLLQGEFDAFEESLWERLLDWEGTGYFWEYWEGEFASEFGYETWDAMPEKLAEWVAENRTYDESPWREEMIRNWTGNVTATLYKPNAKAPENLIYAPGSDTEAEDHKLARYLIDAFGVKLHATSGNKTARLMQDIEVIYGGYDREQLVLCGRVDLPAIYAARKTPDKVRIGPEDSAHLLFYEFHNGCGNMGEMDITKTRVMPASLRVDGTHGYGVDSCYGFTGSYWRHEIRIV